jgi:glycosyltransferase involved in cell wall biosynthesis
MKKKFGFAAFLLALLVPAVLFLTKEKKPRRRGPLAEKPFVVVVPSYNNSAFCEQNILSILNQEYQNFRVIFIDDASPDDTFEKVKAIVDRSPLKDRVQLIHNEKNQGSLKNLYTAIHSCRDDEIVLRCDGDDFLARPDVLKKLNKIYVNPSIWMTYGNYLDYPTYQQKPKLAEKFPASVLKERKFRQHRWVTHHPQTFYAGLFKKIAQKDLMKDGQFYPMAGDVGFVLPMLEMASGHFEFVDEVLYLYNRKNPLNDHIVNLAKQAAFDQYIRSLPPYEPLSQPPYYHE